MRDTVKALMSLSWAMTLFGARQMQSLLARPANGRPADGAAAFDTVTRVARDHLTGTFRELFEAGERLQRDLFGPPRETAPAAASTDYDAEPATAPDWAPPSPAAIVAPTAVSAPAPAGRDSRPGERDNLTHVVIGEGLAAGMGDFTLREDSQRFNFANLLTQHIGVPFSQPLIQAPGIGNALGFPALPVIVPALMQTTVLDPFPPAAPFTNVSVPGLTLEDALALRPNPPLIHRDNAKQTAVNLLIGLPELLRGDGPLPTPLERALGLSPFCAILELGYYEFLEAAVTGDLRRLPDPDAFCSRYARLLTALRRANVLVLVLTVPDPTDTAHFSTPEAAARFLRVAPGVLDRAYRLPPDARVTVNGLLDMAQHLLAGQFRPLRPGAVLAGEAARTITARVRAANGALTALSQQQGAVVYDLHGLFRRVRESGATVGSRRLTADYFGGFYSLNGYYPGATGQALIADALVPIVNEAFRASFPAIDVGAVLATDPVAGYRAAQGRELSWEELTRPAPAAAPPRAEPVAVIVTEPPSANVPTAPQGTVTALRLPPGLEQVLPLNKSLSFHGDGIRIVHCSDDKEAQYGGCASLLFGGLALFGSHLRGSLRIKFSPPAHGVTHFQVDWGDGLVGDDGILTAPQFFRLPALRPRVVHWPETVVSGDLNLASGEVTNLDFRVSYLNSALEVLFKGNPKFPKQPIQFPGAYGSAWARFAQRPDGRLDFIFQGSTFIPLGKELGSDPVRWPLMFGALGDHPASVPAAGTALHPHLHLSTEDEAVGEAAGGGPDLPCNAVREFTAFAHNTSFGDKFSLTGDDLGGPALGRSQLMGRVQVQFGEPFGDSLPVAVSPLPPGGMLARPDPTPVAAEFPSRLPGAMVGHDEFLRFPLRNYFLDAVGYVHDPFDLAVGAVNRRTGRVYGELLQRGFIDQNLFFALVRVEPRTPRSSFYFRGPACFERGANGQLVYRFNGEVHIPYPEGFGFPSPDLTTSYVIGPGSALDPFLRLQAMHGGRPPQMGKTGSADRVLASNGNTFSYRYSIPRDPARERATFEYTNHTQGGSFRLCSLAWHAFSSSRGRAPRGGEHDTVTFAGFGTWSRGAPDRLHLATVQVSTSREYPYVSIQIDGGLVSNVNTKPAEDAATLP
jgi:hypothetical protein